MQGEKPPRIATVLALSPIVLRPEEVAERLKIGDQFVQEILEAGVEI